MVEFIVPALSEGPDLEELSERLHEVMGRSLSKKLIIDFSRVKFIASRAVVLLTALSRTVECYKGKLILCGVRKQARQAFRFSGLDRLLIFHDTRDDALASLNTPAEASSASAK